MIRFRDITAQVVPWWLRFGLAKRIFYAAGAQLDALIDGAALAASPGAAVPDALPVIGRERRIRRGPHEDDTTYAARLRPWLDAHRHRGGPFELLNQVGGFYAATPFAIELLYHSGMHFSRDVGTGAVTWERLGYTVDIDTAHWARWWLIYRWPYPFSDDGIWGDPGVWEDAGTWGSTLTAAEVEELRLVPADWNNGKSIGYVTLLGANAELWGWPAGTWGDAGTWGAGPAITVYVG